jgi:Beta galactosidase small chain
MSPSALSAYRLDWRIEGDGDVGLYALGVADPLVPYVRPQENGAKTDVRGLSLTGPDGVGRLARETLELPAP